MCHMNACNTRARLICIPLWRMHPLSFVGRGSRQLVVSVCSHAFKKFYYVCERRDRFCLCVSAPPEVCAAVFLDNKPHVTGAQGNFNGPKQNKFSAATLVSWLLIYYLSARESAERSRARLKREQTSDKMRR
jgi:hypothetical protein